MKDRNYPSLVVVEKDNYYSLFHGNQFVMRCHASQALNKDEIEILRTDPYELIVPAPGAA